MKTGFKEKNFQNKTNLVTIFEEILSKISLWFFCFVFIGRKEKIFISLERQVFEGKQNIPKNAIFLYYLYRNKCFLLYNEIQNTLLLLCMISFFLNLEICYKNCYC